ncbi:hypothetical protein CANINC_001373 [Pichia inconspicua]|uniref:Peroxin/Ferlin domain-containing protein n=1 Tax=Pichia inconspicua TaxID=52247 RepID=A0A4T0X5D4_9ASCO|nr:hypothetical protein CANINC_001373 [[Candida] inconspicua]
MALAKSGPNTDNCQIYCSNEDEVNTLWLSAFDISGDIKQQVQNSVEEYSHLDQNINRLPQFKCNQELLECLSQFTLQSRTYQVVGDLGEQLRKGKNNVKYEIIIENQRGATMFGSKVYTQQQLFYPVDPPKFQTLSGMKLQSLELYPEPNKDWKWVWDKWHVLMINDVDEYGWIYSKVRFNSNHWTSAGRFGKFARRRIWIRMMEKESEDSSIAQDEDAQSTLSVLQPAKELNIGSMWSFKHSQKTHFSTTEQKGLNMKNPVDTTHLKTQKGKEKGSVLRSFDSTSNTSDKAVSFSDSNMKENNFNEREDLSLKGPRKLCLEIHKKSASSNNQHIRHMYSEVSACTDDANKIEKLLYFMSQMKNEILLLLIEDFELCQNKSNSWLYKILRKFYLPASRKLFLKRFQHDIIDKIDENSESGCSLKILYGICDDAIANEKL